MQKETSLQSNDDVTAVLQPADHGPQSTTTSIEDPPLSHGFLDKDPVTSAARSLYFKSIGGALFLILTYVIWGVLPIYWGSVYRLYEHTHNLHGWIAVSIPSLLVPCLQSEPCGCLQDLDGGAIGQTVTQTFIGGSGPDTKMTWIMAPSNLNLTTREQFENALVDEKTWAIVASM